jgi:hypothetical protein
MTLCGVLKNILLVVASVFIWGSVITWLQFIGYGIATGGLVYYGVGYEGIMTYYSSTQQYARKMWEGEPETSTASKASRWRKILFIVLYVTIVLLLVIGIALKTQTGASLASDLSDRMTSIFR